MVREILQEMSDLLARYDEANRRMTEALAGDDEQLWDYLVSNELWGGSGSIADQAGSDPEARRELERLMIGLGREQMKIAKVNVRTSMWVEAFEKWRAAGLR
jgi:hypothetical protein